MNLSLQENKSLFSRKIMNSFFKKICGTYFGADELVYLKISSQKTLSKNLLILYELSLLKKGKKFSKKIWGKTIKKRQFKLLKFLAETKVGKYIPNYFGYLPSLKFSFSENIEGQPVRVFEKNFSFWNKNITKIGQLLAEFQNTKIPNEFLKTHKKNAEKKCTQGWLQKIGKYSSEEGEKYKKIKNYYLKNLSNKCWFEKSLSFNHFDFQASNIFYIKKTENLALLDFDLSKKFHPATDLANFWVHFYVMARYHFSQKKVLLLCEKFLQAYHEKTKIKKDFTDCFNLLRLRTILDIAQITASVFKKPSEESQKVFNKLNELLKICL